MAHVLASPLRYARRAGLLISAGLLGLALATQPAAAAPQPTLGLTFSGKAIAAGAVQGKIFAVNLWSYGVPVPGKATVTIDASAATDQLSVTLAGSSPDCAQSGSVITCRLLPAPVHSKPSAVALLLKPRSGAQPGTSVRLTAQAVAPGADPAGIVQIISITGPGPDFQTQNFFFDSVAPGSTIAVRPAWRNVGDEPAAGFTLRVDGRRADIVGTFGNCYYRVEEEESSAICPFLDYPLAVGEGAAVGAGTPFVLRLDRLVEGLTSYYSGYEVQPLPPGTTFVPPEGFHRGTGAPLQIETRTQAKTAAWEVDPIDNVASIVLKSTVNPADMAATGATIHAAIGQTVTVELTLVNHGPIRLSGPEGQPVEFDQGHWPSLKVEVPAGVQVVEAFCNVLIGDVAQSGTAAPGQPRYRCYSDDMSPGTSATFPLKLKVTAPGHHRVLLTARGGTADPVPANNSAAVDINPTTAGPVLPASGSRTALIAATGLVLAGLGMLLYRLGRRPNRSRFDS